MAGDTNLETKKENLRRLLRWLGLLLILVLVSIFHLTTIHPYHNWGPDFAKYIAQAKSIVEGFDYLNIYVEDGGNYWLPWGFPLLLSPIIAVFGLDFMAMKIFVTIFFIMSLPLIFVLFRDRLTRFSRLLLILLFVLSPWIFNFKNNILSDFPYLFFLLLSIYFVQEFIINKRVFFSKIFSYVLLGFVLSITINIRTQGIVLLPTLLICQYFQFRSKRKNIGTEKISFDLSEFIPISVAVICMAIMQFAFANGSDGYFQLVSQNIALKKIITNIRYYFLLPAEFFGHWTISAIIYGMTIPLFIRGLWVRFKVDYLFILYSVFTLGLLIIWPYQQGFRFILSVMVFYLYFMFFGLKNVQGVINFGRFVNLEIKNVQYIGGIILVLFMISKLRNEYNYLDQRIIDGPFTYESIELFEYIKAETEEDAIIMFRTPPVLTLFCDRRSVVTETDLSKIEVSKAEYYINSDISEGMADSADFMSDSSLFTLIYQNKSYQVYQIDGYDD